MPHLPPRARDLPQPRAFAPAEGPPPENQVADDMPPSPDREPARPPIKTKPTRRKYGRPTIGLKRLDMKKYSPDFDEVANTLMATTK
jgi:hypothetical protein